MSDATEDPMAPPAGGSHESRKPLDEVLLLLDAAAMLDGCTVRADAVPGWAFTSDGRGWVTAVAVGPGRTHA